MKKTNKKLLGNIFKVIMFAIENISEIIEIKKTLDKTKKYDLHIQAKISDKFIDDMDWYLDQCVAEVLKQDIKNNS